jgi:trigger factor
MKTTTKENSNDLKITVTLTPDEMQTYLEMAAQQHNIDGFRPGKAPYKTVEENIGAQRLWGEAGQIAIDDNYPKAIKDLKIVSRPEIDIEKLAPGNDFVFTISVTVLPKFDLPDYKKIAQETQKEKKEVKATEEDSNLLIEELRKTRVKTKYVMRPAKEGDEVVLDIKGDDGLNKENFPVVIDEKRMEKEFFTALLGVKEADEKKVGPFNIKVKGVYERELPEVNDEFAKSLGGFKDVDDLKAKIKENIQLEKEAKEKERIRLLIMENIRKASKFETPPALIERELNGMIEEMKSRFPEGGYEKWLADNKKTEEDLKKDWHKKAEERVAIGIIFYELGEKEGIEATQKEIDEEANLYLKKYANTEEAKKAIQPEQLRLYCEDIIKNRKIMNLLENNESNLE